MNKKLIILLLICSTLTLGCTDNPVDEPIIEPMNEPAPELDIYVETNADKCERIAEEYFNSHTYVGDDVYDCDNMACDIWNILKTEGINSKIAIGNVDYKIDSINDANHAWILAEVEPGLYLAIECTGGYIVYDNPLYYECWTFNNPKNLREYVSLCRDYNNQIERYNDAVEEYNKLWGKYGNKKYPTNELNIIQSQLDTAVENINNEVEILNDISNEIEYILTYG